MIVHYSYDGGLAVQEAEDFRRFKIVLGCLPEQHLPLPKLTFVDDHNALMGIDVVPTLPGAPTDPAWRAEYDRMISTAAKFGWIDEASNLIRAHVERTSS